MRRRSGREPPAAGRRGRPLGAPKGLSGAGRATIRGTTPQPSGGLRHVPRAGQPSHHRTGPPGRGERSAARVTATAGATTPPARHHCRGAATQHWKGAGRSSSAAHPERITYITMPPGEAGSSCSLFPMTQPLPCAAGAPIATGRRSNLPIGHRPTAASCRPMAGFDGMLRLVWPPGLPARRACHQPALFARPLDQVAAANAIRPIIIRVERIGDAPAAAAARSAAGRDGPCLLRGMGCLAWRQARALGRRRRRLPHRHHMGHRLRRAGRRGRDAGRKPRSRPGRKPVVPCLRTQAEGGPSRRLLAGLRAARSYMHDLDDPAAGRAAPAWDVHQLALVARSVLLRAKSGEDAINVGHGSSGLPGALHAWAAPNGLSERHGGSEMVLRARPPRPSGAQESISGCR